MRDAALGYGRKRWEILPLRGKIPAISKRAGGNGVIDATSDLDQIAAWWERYPNANIGARVPAGVIVTDTDPRTNPSVDDDLRDAVGELPDTLTAISGRGDGGRHYYWRHPGGRIYTRDLPAGVDVKTNSGYVVLPPSIHPDSGRPYRWVDPSAPIFEAPLRLQLLLAPPPPPKRPKPSRWATDGDSPADTFTATTTWRDVLEPNGWVAVDQAGNQVAASHSHRSDLRDGPPRLSVRLLDEHALRDHRTTQPQRVHPVQGLGGPRTRRRPLSRGPKSPRHPRPKEIGVTVPPLDDEARTAPPETTWTPVDMGMVGLTLEEATIFTRVDDVGLLYPSRVHWFQGESESHKTWVLLIAMAQILDNGLNVAYIDFEDHPSTIKARLEALGVPAETITDPNRFVYIRPDEPLQDDQRAELFAALDTNKPALVVVDGVSEAMNIEDLDPNSTPDTAEWIRRLPKLIAATGPAVAVIDHQTKAMDGRKGWAIGSQHKKAGTDGAAYDVTAIRKVHRAYFSDPVEGLVSVKVSKDRVGYVRGHSLADNAATIKITAWPDGGITYQITTAAIANDHEIRQRIAQYLDGAPGSSKRSIRDAGGKGELIDQAIAGMIADGHVRMEKQGAAHAHYLTDKGHETYLGDTE